MENILITGGAGFIGAHLSRTLLADGHKVVVADDFTLGNRENVADCLENPNFTLVEQDVTDVERLVALMEEYQIERVYHWQQTLISRRVQKFRELTMTKHSIRPTVL